MLPYDFLSLNPIFIKSGGYNPVKKKSLNEDIWICDNSLQFPGNISGLLGILPCLQNLDQKLFISLWKSLFPVHQRVTSYNQSKWKKYKKLLIINLEMSVLSQNKYIRSASELFSSFLTPFQCIKFISIGLILLTSVVLSELNSSPFPWLILRLHVFLPLLLLILKKESQKPKSIDWLSDSELLIPLNIQW